jgi:hypothetical protein
MIGMKNLIFINFSKKRFMNRNIVGVSQKNFCKNIQDEKDPGKTIRKGKGGFSKIKEYGKLGLIGYTIMNLFTFSGIFLLFQYKYLDSNKTIIWFEKTGIDKYIDIKKYVNKLGPTYFNVAVAYAVNSVADIIKIPTLLFLLKLYTKGRK